MRLISVIMGVYNPDALLLARAVESILSQTYAALELIVCDDGSNAETKNQLNHWAGRDARVILTRHETNRGLAAALNTCLARACGEFIARQDADDASAPTRLAAEIDYLDSHSELAFVGTAVQLVDAGGAWAVKRFPAFPTVSDFLFALPYNHGSLVFRAAPLRACNGYTDTPRTTRVEDYELLIRMHSLGFRGSNLAEPLYAYQEDETVEMRRKYRYRINEALIRAQWFARLGLLPMAIPYVVKPLVVGLLPRRTLRHLKTKHYHLYRR